jgi:hypothetical protein
MHSRCRDLYLIIDQSESYLQGRYLLFSSQWKSYLLHEVHVICGKRVVSSSRNQQPFQNNSVRSLFGPRKGKMRVKSSFAPNLKPAVPLAKKFLVAGNPSKSWVTGIYDHDYWQVRPDPLSICIVLSIPLPAPPHLSKHCSCIRYFPFSSLGHLEVDICQQIATSWPASTSSAAAPSL